MSEYAGRQFVGIDLHRRRSVIVRLSESPEAWIAPPVTRELRELVRHRAKLVGLRSHCKAEVHAVLAKCGIQISMSDLFGLESHELLDRTRLPGPYSARVQSLRG